MPRYVDTTTDHTSNQPVWRWIMTAALAFGVVGAGGAGTYALIREGVAPTRQARQNCAIVKYTAERGASLTARDAAEWRQAREEAHAQISDEPLQDLANQYAVYVEQLATAAPDGPTSADVDAMAARLHAFCDDVRASWPSR